MRYVDDVVTERQIKKAAAWSKAVAELTEWHGIIAEITEW